MPHSWQLQEAKSRFSELVKDALLEGPQKVTRHGEEVVVVLSVQDYRKLTRPKGDLVQFFRDSPLAEAELDLARSREKSRPVDL
jgi:prevent-host-death family protein